MDPAVTFEPARRARTKAPLLSLCALLVVVVGSGCQGQAPKTEAPPEGYESSFTGYLSKTYQADIDISIAATKAALQKLGFNLVEQSGALFEKTFDVESEDHTSAVVKISAVSKSTTRISVKVGYLLGNRDAAQRIHSEIDGELAERHEEAKRTQGKWGRSIGITPPAQSSPSPRRLPVATSTPTPLPIPTSTPHRTTW